MRKNFTQLLSFIMLLCMVLFQAVAVANAPAPVPTTTSIVPASGYTNVDARDGSITFVLTFNEAVVPGTQHAGIIALTNNTGVQLDPIQITGTTSTNPVTGSSAVINGNVVTVTFLRNASEGDVFYITASNDALMDAGGLYWGGIPNGTYWVQIGDYTPPTVKVVTGVKQFTPRDNSWGHALDANLSVQFTEDVQFGTGYIGLYTADGNVVELFDVVADAGTKLTVAGDLVTINPTADLSELQAYYVRIGPMAISDGSGNDTQYFAGINDNTTWNFIAADVTPPTVAFDPATSADDIQQGKAMVMTFSDNRTAAGLSFVLHKTSDHSALTVGANVQSMVIFKEGAVDVPTANYTATYTATNQITIAWVSPNKFDHLANYTYGVQANMFEDEEENAMDLTTATFTAGDFMAPELTAGVDVRVEAAGTGGAPNNVAADLETTKIFMQLDGVTDDSGLPVEVHYLIVANGATAPTPAAVMAGPILPMVTDNPDMYRGFASVDGAGNTLASTTDYDVYFAAVDHATVPNTSTQAEVTATEQDVQTNDILAPVIQSVKAQVNTVATAIPEGGSLGNVDYNSTLVITLDEPVNTAINNASFRIVYDDGTANGETLATDGSEYSIALSGGNMVITITGTHRGPASDGIWAAASWISSGTYTLYIDNNKVSDDVSVAGHTGTDNYITAKQYTFTVEDYKGPIPLFTSNNQDVETGVATDANIVIDLGEACTRADGTPITSENVFFRDHNGGATEGQLIPDAVTITDGRYITIDPTSSLIDGNLGYTYQVELTSTIQDLAGNKLGYFADGVTARTQRMGDAVTGNVYQLELTTADETDPVVTFDPANGTSGLDKDYNGVQVDVSINENVYKANGDEVDASDGNFLRSIISFVRNSDNTSYMVDVINNVAGSPSTFTIVPLDNTGNPLTEYNPEDSYTVTLMGLYDAAGNPISYNSTTFSIREYTPPSIISLSPADNSVGVAADATVSITFNEPITANAGTLTITDDTDPDWIGVGVNSESFNVTTDVTITGNTVTLNSHTAFAELDNYHITLSNDAFKDVVGNLMGPGISSATAWNFTGFDNTAPVIANQTTDVTPNDDATDVAKPTSLVIHFTEASGQIVAGPGKIYVREIGNTGITDLTFNAQSSDVNIVGTDVTITVNPALFDYGTEYWVEIDADAFRDPAGNYFAGYVADQTKWNFTIEADPAPYYVIADCVPTDDANSVALDQPIIIKFSEPVWITNPTGKYLTIRNASDATAQTTVYFDGPTVLWSWNTAHDVLTIQHPDDFLPDASYFITVTSNTFFDSAGQGIDLGVGVGELDAPGDLNFTTADLTPPTVTSVTVNDVHVEDAINPNPTGIAKDGNIVISFSEPVTIATPNSSVQLNAGALTYTATFADNVLTINPTADFASEATITVTTVAGQIVDKATSPNDLGAVQIAQFVVQDYIDPKWDDAGAAAVAIPVGQITSGNNQVTFTLSVDEDACKIYYYVTDAGALSSVPTPATVKASANGFAAVDDATTSVVVNGLAGDHAYDFYFIAEDAAGNLMDGVLGDNEQVRTAMDVSTLDNVPPELDLTANTGGYTLGLSPADGASCVDISGGTVLLKLKFNEAIDDASIVAAKFWVRRASNDHSLTITDVSAAGNVVTITVASAQFAQAEGYYVEIDGGALADMAGNVWEDIFYGPDRWNFTTNDTTPPEIAQITGVDNVTPREEAVGVPVSASNPLVMVFNEPVVADATGTMFIDIYRVGDANPQEKINVSGPDVSISADGKTVTVTRHNVYASEEMYYVIIPSGAFKDLACSPNNFAGFTADPGEDDYDWAFTTADIDAPVVMWDPDGSSIVNSTTATITATFMDPKHGAENPDGVVNTDDLKDYFSASDMNGSVDITSAVITNGVVTIVLDGGLTSNNTYTITFTNTDEDLTDEAGNVIANSSVTFNTEDRQSPTVSITADTTDACGNAKVDASFIIEFNKPIVNSVSLGGGTDNLAPTAAELQTLGEYFTFKTDGGSNVPYTVTVMEAGKKYAIVPVTELSSGSDYEIIWTATKDAGADPTDGTAEVKDQVFIPDGNILDLPLEDRTFDFTTEDVVAPDLLADAFTPADGGTPSSLAAPLVVDFDEPVQAGVGTIYIRFSNGQIFQPIPVSELDFSDADEGSVIIPHNQFLAFTDYYVVIPAGAIVDQSCNHNEFAGFTDDQTWNFSTDDGTPPMVLIYDPYNGEQNIQTDRNLVLTFDENVQIGSGNLVIYLNNGDSIPGDGVSNGNAQEVIPINSAQVTISGSNPNNPMKTSDVVTINPSMSFDPMSSYYVRIDEGWVKDMAGNDYAGINDNTTWTFGITDPTAPQLISTTPENGATGVPQDLTGVTMTFDRDVLIGTDPLMGSLDTEEWWVKLYQYYYNAQTYQYETKLIESVDTADMVIDGNVVTFDIHQRLADNQVYYFLATPGSFTNTASSHNWWNPAISSPFAWRFTTLPDTIPPMLAGDVSESVSMYGATCVDPDSVSLSLTFDEGVQAGLGNMIIHDAMADTVVTTVPASTAVVDGNMITFTVPAGELADRMEYYVTLDDQAVSDSALVPNPWDPSVIAPGDWVFYTGDFTPPMLMAYSPMNGAVGLDNTVDVMLTFSETVIPGTAPLVVTDLSDSSVVYNAVVTADQIMDNVVTVPVSGLMDGGMYGISFGEGLVTDTAYVSNGEQCGNLNPSAAFMPAGEDTLQFTIDDNVAPVITGMPTDDNETSMVTITITASEAVTPVADSMVHVTGGDFSMDIPVTDFTTTNDTVFTADVSGLPDTTMITVVVDSAAFVDGAVNPNPTAPITWTFMTGDNTPPAIVDTYPEDGADLGTYIDILNNGISFVFNEPVTPAEGGTVTVDNMIIPVDSSIVTMSGDTVIVMLGEGLELNAAHVVTVSEGAYVDGNGNGNIETAWSFNITDHTFDASCLSGDHFKPYDGSTGVGSDINLEITFCENILPGMEGKKVRVYELDQTSLNHLFQDYTITSDMINGNILTIPVTGLQDWTSYGVLVDAGAVTDEAGNEYAGISDPTYWNFTTGDNTAPTAMIVSPDSTENLPYNFDVMVEFSEPVTNVDASTIEVVGADATVAMQGDTAAVVSISAVAGAEVSVTVTDAITDIAGNALAEEVSQTFMVGDWTAPVLDAMVPETDNNTENTFDVMLYFSEPVIGDANAITVDGGMLDTVMVDETDSTLYHVMISGEDGDSITVTVNPDHITDMSVNHNMLVLGDGVDGIGNYVVGDHVAPEIVSVTANVIDTAATPSPFTVTVEFTEPVANTDAGILVNGLPATISNVAGNVYTISISGVQGETKTLQINGSLTDASLNANPLANPGSWTYIIGDITPPTVTFVANPDPQALTFNVTLDFSEAVNGVVTPGAIRAINGTITNISGADGDDMYVVTITGESFAEVTLQLSNIITDLSGNKLAPTSATYTIGDFVPPQVTVMTPTGDVGDDTTFPLKLTFDEPVVAGSGSLTVYNASTKEAFATYDISQVIVYGNSMTVPGVSLDKNTDWFVLVSPGFVTDKSGNNFAGIMGITTWTFHTGNFATKTPVIENIQFKVYPNPFSDEIHIDNADKLSRVVISNIAGQRVLDIVHPEQVVRTPNLVSGVYVITLFTEDGIVKTDRIVKR